MHIYEYLLNTRYEPIADYLEATLNQEDTILQVLTKSHTCYFYGSEIKLQPRLFNFLLQLADKPSETVEYHVLVAENKILKKGYMADNGNFDKVEFEHQKRKQRGRASEHKRCIRVEFEKIIATKIKAEVEMNKIRMENFKTIQKSKGESETQYVDNIKQYKALLNFYLKKHIKKFKNPKEIIGRTDKTGFKLMLDDNEVIFGT